VLGVLGNREEAKALSNDIRDPRISTFILLDPGATEGFTPSSLKALGSPVLLIVAGTETREIAASKADASYAAPYLDTGLSRYIEIPDATHFSFVQLCKPGAEALIEEESPGEGFVCRDGGTRSRADIHRQIAKEIRNFLAKSLP
jgi:predicted dienelactone hydrolase